jgi:hypothetical protein
MISFLKSRASSSERSHAQSTHSRSGSSHSAEIGDSTLGDTAAALPMFGHRWPTAPKTRQDDAPTTYAGLPWAASKFRAARSSTLNDSIAESRRSTSAAPHPPLSSRPTQSALELRATLGVSALPMMLGVRLPSAGQESLPTSRAGVPSAAPKANVSDSGLAGIGGRSVHCRRPVTRRICQWPVPSKPSQPCAASAEAPRKRQPIGTRRRPICRRAMPRRQHCTSSRSTDRTASGDGGGEGGDGEGGPSDLDRPLTLPLSAFRSAIAYPVASLGLGREAGGAR